MRRPVHRGLFVVYDGLLQQDGCSLQFDPRVYSNRLLREFVGHAISFIRAAASDPDASLEELIETDGVGAALRARNARASKPHNRHLPLYGHSVER
jgi:hypothetical protein